MKVSVWKLKQKTNLEDYVKEPLLTSTGGSMSPPVTLVFRRRLFDNGFDSMDDLSSVDKSEKTKTLPTPASKLDGHTSKPCPHCFQKGKKVSRHRTWKRSAPLRRDQLQVKLPIHCPRFPLLSSFWNICGPTRWIRSLIAPTTTSAWFECYCIARCSKCGIVDRVGELDYARQFGKIRLWLFTMKEWASRILDRFIPEG